MVSGALGSAVFSAVTVVLLMVNALPLSMRGPIESVARLVSRFPNISFYRCVGLSLHPLRTRCSFRTSFQAASSGCGPGRHPIYGLIHGAASVIRLEIPSAKKAPLRG